MKEHYQMSNPKINGNDIIESCGFYVIFIRTWLGACLDMVPTNSLPSPYQVPTKSLPSLDRPLVDSIVIHTENMLRFSTHNHNAKVKIIRDVSNTYRPADIRLYYVAWHKNKTNSKNHFGAANCKVHLTPLPFHDIQRFQISPQPQNYTFADKELQTESDRQVGNNSKKSRDK